MREPKLSQDEPQSLARMMDLDEDDSQLWEPAELADILRHQLDAAIDFDLARLGPAPQQVLESVRSSGALDIRTFRNLFDHANPPVELLQWTKQFAKSCRSQRDGSVPDEVATVLYLLSIITARQKCGKQISRLDDNSLGYGLRWALAQPWLDGRTREILTNALKSIGESS